MGDLPLLCLVRVIYFYTMTETQVIKIALADDHAVTRRGTISLLESLGGFKVVTSAGDGKELLEELAKAEQQADICIVDIAMPSMDGFTLTGQLKRKWPEIKVLALSTYNYTNYIIRMILAGANGFLKKTCEIEEIKTALYAIYQDGYYYSEWADSAVFHLAHSKSLKSQNLSPRELEFIRLCCSELSYNEIAEQMETTYKTVESYRERVCNKLNLKSRPGLVMYAVQTGIYCLDIHIDRDDFVPIIKTKN